jgi:hypothetical protein
MKTQASILVLGFFLFCFSHLSAQSEGDYRTFQSGDWHSFNTWEVVIGGEWTLASSIPAAETANNVRIRNGHNIVINDHITIDQTMVESGASLLTAFDKRIIVSDGAGDDLVIYGSLTTSGTTNQNSIGLSGNGKVIIYGDYYWQSGGITNSDFWVAPGGTLHLDGSARIMRSGAVLNNQGTVLHYHEGGLLAGVGNSIFNNLEGGVYHAMGSTQIRYEYNWDWYDQYTFNNYGTFLKTMPETSIMIYRGVFNNYGDIDLQEGDFLLDGSATHSSSGQIDICGNCNYQIQNNARLALLDGAEISGNGCFKLNQSNTNTVLTLSGTTQSSPGLTLDFVNGTIGGSGAFNFGGEFVFRGGRYEGPTLNLSNSALLRVVSGAEKRLCGSSVVNNYGQIIIEDNETWHSNYGAVINNHIGGLLDFISDGSIQYRSDLGGTRTILNNYGTLQKSAGSGTSSLNRITFNNFEDALCHVQTGVLQLLSYGAGTNYGSVLVADGSTFGLRDNFDWTMAEGSSITGSGTLLLNGADMLLSGTVDGATIGADIDFQMLSGSIGDTGKLTIWGNMLWSGGTLWCGNLIISADSQVLGTGATDELRSSGYGYITNYGQLIITAPIGSGNITYINQEGAILEFGQGGGVWHTGGGANSTTLTNHGILRKSGDSFSNLYKINTTSDGTVVVLAGTIQFENSAFNNHALVDIQAGSLRFSGSSGSGAGNYFIAENGLLVVAGNYSLSCEDGVQMEGSGSIQLIGGGSLNTMGTANGLIIADSILINQAGGNLGGAGKLYFNGTHNWTSGNCLVGNYFFGEDGLLTISSTDTKRISGSFHNSGTMHMSGSLGGGNLNLYNYAGAQILIDGNLGIWHTGGGSSYPQLHNYGLLQKSGTETAACDVLYLNNYGHLHLAEGTLTFYCPSAADYNLEGSTAVYHLAGKLVFRYGNLHTNRVDIVLDGPLAEIRDHNNNNLLASCTGTSSSGSFTLLNGANLTTNSNFNNAGILDLGTGLLGGSGNFTAADNSSLIIGSVDGISLSESTGNIQKTGSRTYSSASHYTYNGVAAQNAGDGLPTVARSLTVNNPGLIIGTALAVTQTLNLINGVVHVSDLTLGSSVSSGNLIRENGYIVGDFCQWLETTDTAVLFPVGTASAYRPVQLYFDDPHLNGGSLCLSTIYADPGLMGLPLTDDGTLLTNIGTEAYWRLSADGGLQTDAYSIGILAAEYSGINDYSTLHLLPRNDDQSPWQSDGLHIPCTGSNDVPLVSRSGLSSLGEFGLGSTPANFISLGSVQNLTIALQGGQIELSWTAASGASSYYIYRSSDPNISDWGAPIALTGATTWIEGTPDQHYFYRVTATNDIVRD